MTGTTPPRMGVFGGTFDPPHLGHLIVARDAAEALALDRVLLVVSARPPHKRGGVDTDPELRLEMLTRALADDPLLEPCDLELRRSGPSYTVDTLRELGHQHPDAALALLIGVDQWRQLRTWREPKELGRLAEIGVMAREGEAPGAVDPGVGVTCTAVPVTRIDLSSSEIRERVRRGRSVRNLVPDAVRTIMERERLYRC